MSEVVWKKTYFEGGQLNHKTPYVNNRRHGVEKRYCKSGRLRWESPYANGRLHGIERLYYNNGQLDCEFLWIRGQLRDDLLGEEHRLTRLMLFGEQKDLE